MFVSYLTDIFNIVLIALNHGTMVQVRFSTRYPGTKYNLINTIQK